jgi:hypothetical protein
MKILENYLFELSLDTKLFRKLKEQTPDSLKKLNNKLLVEYHRKCHMLYSGNINRRPLNKDFINLIVDIHDMIVNEMTRRKMNHQSLLKKV